MPETKLFEKDQAQVSLTLRGNPLSGTVTDADLLCFYGMFFLEQEERQQLERRGTRTLLSVVQQRQQQMVAELEAGVFQKLIAEQPELEQAEAKARAKKRAAELFDQELGEAIFFKINNNPSRRVEFATRVIEIFPNIDQSMVDYDRHRGIGRCRLSSTETMRLVMTIMGGLMGLVYEEPVTTSQVKKLEVQEVEASVAADGSAIALQPEVQENPFGLSAEVIAALSPEAKIRLGI